MSVLKKHPQLYFEPAAVHMPLNIYILKKKTIPFLSITIFFFLIKDHETIKEIKALNTSVENYLDT